jgi:hypothetical protein
MKYLILICIITFPSSTYSQDQFLKKLTFAGYGELYYSYDFSNPQNHEKPGFLYNHKRHNELNANLILLSASYSEENSRAKLALMGGNYAEYNLSAEPEWAQFINEANIGIRLSKKQALWLDAGILPSHLGFESAITNDSWTLTRSLGAENSPYYESGVKFGYTSKNNKLVLAALFLNGWQKIRKPNFVQRPSVGTQIIGKPNEKLLLNYSTFLGSDRPDTSQAIRQFHNLYLKYEPTNAFGFIVGFDIGRDKGVNGKYGVWYTPVFVIRQQATGSLGIALRGEYYHDPKQIIISANSPDGFQVFGCSLSFEYKLSDNFRCRLEGKWFRASDFLFDGQQNNFSLTTNVTVNL